MKLPSFHLSWTWTTDQVAYWWKRFWLRRKLIKLIKEKKYVGKF